jgi:hypothetical protein
MTDLRELSADMTDLRELSAEELDLVSGGYNPSPKLYHSLEDAMAALWSILEPVVSPRFGR